LRQPKLFVVAAVAHKASLDQTCCKNSSTTSAPARLAGLALADNITMTQHKADQYPIQSPDMTAT